uniref:DNA repair protein RecN n=1 Tax=Flavobacterium sp. TaxID=239 RepID=UPI00404A0E3C
MLTHLSIKNFALIESLSIDFSDGFQIITGETGAGKSILLGALGLVLGKRADLNALKDKTQKCFIEVQIDISKFNLVGFFEANDLDYDNNTVIRREILPNGKSRAFVNDSPVILSQLSDLGEQLIDIHSQHQTNELLEEAFQFNILDAFAKNQGLLDIYSKQLKDFQSTEKQLVDKKKQLQTLKNEQDYNNFLLEELEKAQLKPNSQEELEALNEELSHVETIQEYIDKSLQISQSDSFGVESMLTELKGNLNKIAGFSKKVEIIANRVESVLIEFKDILNEMQFFADSIETNPNLLSETQSKLQLIYGLQQKHQVDSVEKLLEIQETLSEKATSFDSLEIQIEKLQKINLENQQKLDKIAQDISDSRKKAAPNLAQEIVKLLQLLGMPNAQFVFEIETTSSYFSLGKDTIKWLFTANKGGNLGLLKKVASGGELSRIMLVIKAITAKHTQLPTIIFDEIDTGVSGEIADKMGEIMKLMSQSMQVLAITHLPQIAAKGDKHYKVKKESNETTTITNLFELDYESRILEIAQMLSGVEVSESAIAHAKALLN